MSFRYSFIFRYPKCPKYPTMVPSWSWSYGSCIYNYLCNQRLLPLKL